MPRLYTKIVHRLINCRRVFPHPHKKKRTQQRDPHRFKEMPVRSAGRTEEQVLAVEPIHARLPRQHRQRHHAAYHVQRVNYHQRKCNAIDTHPRA